jgi:hypothetical protein
LRTKRSTPELQYSSTPRRQIEHSLSAVADGSGRDPLRVGLTSEAALHEIGARRRRKDEDEYEHEVENEVLKGKKRGKLGLKGFVS